MKKILLSIFLLIALSFNTTFWAFQIKTNLSETNQKVIQTEVNKIYLTFSSNLSKQTYEKQVTAIEAVVKKLDTMLLTQKKEMTIYILAYLRYKLAEDLDTLNQAIEDGEDNNSNSNNNSSSSCLTGYTLVNWECVSLASTCTNSQHVEDGKCVSNERTCYDTNWKWTQRWSSNKSTWWTCDDLICDSWYILVDWECKAESEVNNIQCLPDYHAEKWECISNIRYCSIDNGSGSETWNNWKWSDCHDIVCTSWFTLTDWKCKVQANSNVPTITADVAFSWTTLNIFKFNVTAPTINSVTLKSLTLDVWMAWAHAWQVEIRKDSLVWPQISSFNVPTNYYSWEMIFTFNSSYSVIEAGKSATFYVLYTDNALPKNMSWLREIKMTKMEYDYGNTVSSWSSWSYRNDVVWLPTQTTSYIYP